ncbi:hypothetical protein BDR05DRAFT_947606 [Suillus weaverae]|nr:hypothetical protein BDR05DRAFT_947606 [Suillus weaverae]
MDKNSEKDVHANKTKEAHYNIGDKESADDKEDKQPPPVNAKLHIQMKIMAINKGKKKVTPVPSHATVGEDAEDRTNNSPVLHKTVTATIQPDDDPMLTLDVGSTCRICLNQPNLMMIQVHILHPVSTLDCQLWMQTYSHKRSKMNKKKVMVDEYGDGVKVQVNGTPQVLGSSNMDLGLDESMSLLEGVDGIQCEARSPLSSPPPDDEQQSGDVNMPGQMQLTWDINIDLVVELNALDIKCCSTCPKHQSAPHAAPSSSSYIAVPSMSHIHSAKSTSIRSSLAPSEVSVISKHSQQDASA